MAVLLDTGILYAYYDRSDAWHKRAVGVLRAEEGGLVVPAPVVPEVDHLLGLRLGARARHVFYEGLADGAYFVADLPRERYARVAELNRRFAELELGFVDAAIVAISEALQLPRVATTDRRDFQPLAEALSLELVP
jgi:predicted nucleic acid-binding protein